MSGRRALAGHGNLLASLNQASSERILSVSSIARKSEIRAPADAAV